MLALEKVWPTKCGWVRLETSFAGISAVDLQRWDRHMSCGVDGRSLRLDGMDDFDILEMVNLIVRPLRTGELAYRYGPQPSKKRKSNGDDDGGELIRIRGQDGTSVYPRAEGKQQRVRQQSCFVCRKYKYKPQNTQWMCRHCGMPLCSLSRGRDRDCLREHQNSECKFIGCKKMKRTKFILPDELKLCLRTRGALQRRKAITETVTMTPPPPARRTSTRVCRRRRCKE